ncbi:MAG TPA: hypothetical protein VEW48_27135 [Thermoanaerobaculia bacterium]|nr:hypothetical protein [Thermoanaerobaculia bacterium]
MPKVALADTFIDWDQLLRGAAEHRDKRQLYVHLDKLKTANDRLRELQALRDSLQGQRQQATQEMREVKRAGKIAAIEVRAILVAIFGHDSERLVQYNMRPRRKRGPRRKPSTEPTPAP